MQSKRGGIFNSHIAKERGRPLLIANPHQRSQGLAMEKADPIDRSMPASRIADKFGGMAELGRALDPPRAPSTIHRWLQSGLIPARHQSSVLDAAKRRRIKMDARDFIPQRENA
jgi:hypothetical protein